MTITQTVEIPASRRLIIDVPPEIPEGLAVLTFAAVKLSPSRGGVSGATAPYLRLLGCHKGVSGGSVNDFLARSREDKIRELAMEERQIEGHSRYADISS
jgi:hypothetical protein